MHWHGYSLYRSGRRGRFQAVMAGTPLRVSTTRTGYDKENHEAGRFIPRPNWPVSFTTLPPDDLVDVIVFLPYGPALHNAFVPYLARYGIDVVADHSLAHSMNLVTGDDTGRVPANRIQAELSRLLGNAPPADAAFVSCAAFTVKQSDLPEMTGALCGCPVLAGVHSVAWHVLDLVGELGLRDKFASDLGLPRLSQPTNSVS